MMAFTHGVIGVVVYGSAVAFSGGQPNGAALGAAAVGAWLPDIDTPTSKAGFCAYPLACWLEKRFGHRTVTHSVFGTVVFAALCAPLLLSPALRFLFPALLAGYVSHLFADAVTKSGVPLAWPNRARFVFPGNERYRITTGSMAEVGILTVVLLIGLLTVPVARYGPRRLLHLVTRDLRGAVRDVEDYSDQWQCVAEVEGYDMLAQRIVADDPKTPRKENRFSIVGRRGDGALMVERDGVLWLIDDSGGGGEETYRIKPRHVRVERVRRRSDQLVVVPVENVTLGELARALARAAEQAGAAPDAVRVSGQAECHPYPAGPFAPVETPRRGIRTVRFVGERAVFDFAQPRHLSAAGAHVAFRHGTLTISLPRGARLRPLQLPTTRRVVAALHLRRHADLLVRPGDLVRPGQALNHTFAQVHEPDPDDPARAEQRQAAKELRALAIETTALSRTSLWPTLQARYVERRAALTQQAHAVAPAVHEPKPPPATAPFEAVVESVEWEPPTIPTRAGERAEHSAQVTLVQVRHR